MLHRLAQSFDQLFESRLNDSAILAHELLNILPIPIESFLLHHCQQCIGPNILALITHPLQDEMRGA